jgi:hypothetical protein
VTRELGMSDLTTNRAIRCGQKPVHEGGLCNRCRDFNR